MKDMTLVSCKPNNWREFTKKEEKEEEEEDA
jgi:hypothetical protein